MHTSPMASVYNPKAGLHISMATNQLRYEDCRDLTAAIWQGSPLLPWPVLTRNSKCIVHIIDWILNWSRLKAVFAVAIASLATRFNLLQGHVLFTKPSLPVPCIPVEGPLDMFKRRCIIFSQYVYLGY